MYTLRICVAASVSASCYADETGSSVGSRAASPPREGGRRTSGPHMLGVQEGARPTPARPLDALPPGQRGSVWTGAATRARTRARPPRTCKLRRARPGTRLDSLGPVREQKVPPAPRAPPHLPTAGKNSSRPEARGQRQGLTHRNAPCSAVTQTWREAGVEARARGRTHTRREAAQRAIAREPPGARAAADEGEGEERVEGRGRRARGA